MAVVCSFYSWGWLLITFPHSSLHSTFGLLRVQLGHPHQFELDSSKSASKVCGALSMWVLLSSSKRTKDNSNGLYYFGHLFNNIDHKLEDKSLMPDIVDGSVITWTNINSFKMNICVCMHIYYCPSLLYTVTKCNLSKGIFLTLLCNSPSLREIRAGTQAGIKAETVVECCLLVCSRGSLSLIFFIQPRAACPGWHCSQCAPSSHISP